MPDEDDADILDAGLLYEDQEELAAAMKILCDDDDNWPSGALLWAAGSMGGWAWPGPSGVLLWAAGSMGGWSCPAAMAKVSNLEGIIV